MNILVSGGSRGLGKAICEQMAKSHTVRSFSRSEGVDCKNLSSLKEIKLDDIDVLINNVGIAYDGILATQGEQSILDMVTVNLSSVMILSKYYTRERLRVRNGGVIINVSSIIGIRGFSGLSVYSATKGAINSFTRSLAREMGPMGFRVNAVLPGYFESDLSKSLSESKRNQIVRRTPLGRLATVDDVVPVVEFLASPASGFITGQLIVVDGGSTI